MLDFRGFNEFVRFQSKHVEGKSRGMFYLRFILHCQNSVEIILCCDYTQSQDCVSTSFFSM
jgi:hypothetical protein